MGISGQVYFAQIIRNQIKAFSVSIFAASEIS